MNVDSGWLNRYVMARTRALRKPSLLRRLVAWFYCGTYRDHFSPEKWHNQTTGLSLVDEMVFCQRVVKFANACDSSHWQYESYSWKHTPSGLSFFVPGDDGYGGRGGGGFGVRDEFNVALRHKSVRRMEAAVSASMRRLPRDNKGALVIQLLDKAERGCHAPD